MCHVGTECPRGCAGLARGFRAAPYLEKVVADCGICRRPGPSNTQVRPSDRGDEGPCSRRQRQLRRGCGPATWPGAAARVNERAPERSRRASRQRHLCLLACAGWSHSCRLRVGDHRAPRRAESVWSRSWAPPGAEVKLFRAELVCDQTSLIRIVASPRWRTLSSNRTPRPAPSGG